ncbi:MAG: hypothetical protein SW833_09475 [Cyanobacteriota bacterium]|nr:hypothetical protein [Cyanobacteriota bacterium]
MINGCRLSCAANGYSTDYWVDARQRIKGALLWIKSGTVVYWELGIGQWAVGSGQWALGIEDYFLLVNN